MHYSTIAVAPTTYFVAGAHAIARIFPSENYFAGLWPDYAELNLKLKQGL